MTTTYLTNSYQKTVVIKSNPQLVFDALINRIDQWWGEVDHQPNALNQVFKVSFGEAFWRFRVIKFKPNTEVVWQCIESNQVHGEMMGIKEEWLDTTLHWQVKSEMGDYTQVHFVHNGLTSHLHCYQVCRDAWNFFAGESLKELLEKDTGMPAIANQ